MFHLIPAPLHRLALRVAHAVRRRWWRIAQVELNGCRILALDPSGRVLLVRHSYGSGNWMLPGGGIGRGEDPLAAAFRELSEETGCTLREARIVGVSEEALYGTVNRVHMVSGVAQGIPRGDGREVIELGFFDAAALPERTSPVLAAALPAWLSAARDAKFQD